MVSSSYSILVLGVFMGKVIIQVMDSIGPNRGGLTKAVFDRFRLLSHERRSVLITVAYQPNIREIFNNLVSDGSLPQHTELMNYYEDQRLAERVALPRADCPHEAWEKGSPYYGASDKLVSGSMIRYFRGGVFEGLVYRDSRGVLRHVDRHDGDRPWVRTFRDTTWIDGSISRREFFDQDNKARFRIYFDTSQRAYLSVWVSSDGYEYRTVEHFSDGSVQHGDTRAANAAWLSRKISMIGESVIYSDEPRTTFALTIDSPLVKHVTSIHTTHYQNNKDSSSGLKHWVSHYINESDNIDVINFFTETQRDDFVRDTLFPRSKTSVIPHYAPLKEARVLSGESCVTKDFVIVSRLAPDKRIDHAIRAFSLVHAHFPHSKLRIWGSGPALKELRNLIKELNIEDSVSLEGHTSAPLQKFSMATASILTSKYEGFGLVITESMACGTPVISYDVIYGPRDVIRPNNGILVEDGNIQKLAEAMIYVLSNEAMSNSMRQNAMIAASKYSRDNWIEGWESTL